jgi:hypothetical protein
VIPILSRAQEKILVLGNSREGPAVYRQGLVPETETLYYAKKINQGSTSREE